MKPRAKKVPKTLAKMVGSTKKAPGTFGLITGRITKGSELLPSIDGRSAAARCFRDTFLALVQHCGGAEHCSETLRLMCRRGAALETELTNLECRFAAQRAAGKEPAEREIDLYSRLTSAQRRIFEALGWQRHQRDITPTLEQYLNGKAEIDDAEAGDVAGDDADLGADFDAEGDGADAGAAISASGKEVD
jgi:hypothetical protein